MFFPCCCCYWHLRIDLLHIHVMLGLLLLHRNSVAGRMLWLAGGVGELLLLLLLLLLRHRALGRAELLLLRRLARDRLGELLGLGRRRVAPGASGRGKLLLLLLLLELNLLRLLELSLRLLRVRRLKVGLGVSLHRHLLGMSLHLLGMSLHLLRVSLHLLLRLVLRLVGLLPRNSELRLRPWPHRRHPRLRRCHHPRVHPGPREGLRSRRQVRQVGVSLRHDPPVDHVLYLPLPLHLVGPELVVRELLLLRLLVKSVPAWVLVELVPLRLRQELVVRDHLVLVRVSFLQ